MTIGRPQMEKQIRGYQAGGIADIANPLLEGNPLLTQKFLPSVQSFTPPPMPAPLKKFEPPALSPIPGPLPPYRRPEDEEDPIIQPDQAEIDKLATEVASSEEDGTFDFDKNYEKYKSRLAPYFSQSSKPSFYDLASDLSAAILSADPTMGPFSAMGKGFNTFSQRLRKEKENRASLDRQLGLKALELAMADERAATDFLNKMELERIKNAKKPYDPLIYEVPQFDSQGNPLLDEVGKQVVEVIEIDPNNSMEVALIRSAKGARQIKLPTSAISVDARQGQSKYSAKAGEALTALEDEVFSEARAGVSQNQLVNGFLAQLTRMGPKNFGLLSAGTLSARKFLQDIGLRPDESIKDQELVLTLGTRIAMGLVQQTKGAISNKEMDLFMAASPSLASTYEGALEQAKYLRKISDYNIKRADALGAFQDSDEFQNLDSDPDRLRAVRRFLLRYDQDPRNSIFTEDERSRLEQLAEQETSEARNLRLRFMEGRRKGEPIDDETTGLTTDFSGS